MRVLYLLALVTLTVCGTSLALDYQPIAAYSEGTALNIWGFGEASAGQLNAGRAYAPVVEVTASSNTGPDGTSGEYQPLKCPFNGTMTSCPDVFDSSVPSLWRTRVSLLSVSRNTWSATTDNTTYTSISTIDTTHYLNSSGSIFEYRFIAQAADTLVTGTTSVTNPRKGYFGGSPIYYFGFGLDSYGVLENSIYFITGGPVILSNTGTHLAKKYLVTPPSGVDTSGFRRISDIPAEWLSDSTKTTSDGKVYAYGFYATGATAPPVAAASGLLPSAFALLFAIFAAVALF